jgi:hypothetical protein
MRKVFEASFQIHINRFSFIFGKLMISKLQAFLGQPFLRRCMEGLFKITFKSRKTSARQVSEFM